jgi:uncharacterized protein involved in exopolysaccharide biosynthesis
MSTPHFDLVDITQTLRKRRRFIIIVTIVAVLLGAAFYFARKKKYVGKTAFLVSNPLYSDRVNVYGAANNKMDYFGDEDDIDKVVALGESDTVMMQVIKGAGLDTAYKLDINDRQQLGKLKDMFRKQFDLKRTETRMMELTYTDPNPDRAARVANEAEKDLEHSYRGIYNTMRTYSYNSLQEKMHEEDSIVNALTDTLARLREESGIYDVISPNRDNIMVGTVRGNGGKNLGRNVELIQNYESLKDMIVSDRAKILSLLQQYSTGTELNDMSFFQVVTRATPPIDPGGPGLIIVLGSSLFLGLFFSSLYVLLTTYYRELIAVER